MRLTRAAKIMAFVGVGLLGAVVARAIDFKIHEQYGVEQLYEGVTSAISTHTVTGYGLSYVVSSVGGTSTFIVKHSTVSGGDVNVNVSSSITVLNGQSVGNRFEGIVVNPVIYLNSIATPGTTAYVDIQYLAPRGGGLP